MSLVAVAMSRFLHYRHAAEYLRSKANDDFGLVRIEFTTRPLWLI